MTRLGVVVALALAGFVAALVAFDDAAWEDCVGEAPTDTAYSAAFDEPVRTGQHRQVIRVRRGGRPVRDARVCVTLRRVGGPATTSGQARQIAPGRYRTFLVLDRAGRWEGRLLIAEDGTAPHAAVPVAVEARPARDGGLR